MHGRERSDMVDKLSFKETCLLSFIFQLGNLQYASRETPGSLGMQYKNSGAGGMCIHAEKFIKGSDGLTEFLMVDLNKTMAFVQLNLLCLVFLPTYAGNTGVNHFHELGSLVHSAKLCHSAATPAPMQPPLVFSRGMVEAARSHLPRQ